MRQIRASFPGIGPFTIESPRSTAYNCIAWTAGDVTRVWWPDVAGKGYWPTSVPRESSVDAFVAAYRSLSYEQCDDGDFEEGVEKIVIYTDTSGVPTHGARQLKSGKWTSKLGRAEDIEHNTATALHGDRYGVVAVYMRRRRSNGEEKTEEGTTP